MPSTIRRVPVSSALFLRVLRVIAQLASMVNDLPVSALGQRRGEKEQKFLQALPDLVSR